MELAIATFMTSVGFTFAEILKMLVLVGFSFLFQGVVIWRIRKPMIALYTSAMEAMNSVPKLETSVADLNKTMQEHMIQTELRIDSVVEDLSDLKKRMSNRQ